MDEDVTVNERFLGFVPAEDLTAESLIKYILDTLSKHNINVNNIVSQGYDGAAVMSGKCSHCSDTYSAACSPSSLCALQCRLLKFSPCGYCKECKGGC